MANGQDNRWAIYLVAFAFLLVLILIAIVFQILIWVGVGLILLGFVLLIIAAHENSNEAGIYGVVAIIGGFVSVMAGLTAYDFLKDIGIVDFLKQIFSQNGS